MEPNQPSSNRCTVQIPMSADVHVQCIFDDGHESGHFAQYNGHDFYWTTFGEPMEFGA